MARQKKTSKKQKARKNVEKREKVIEEIEDSVIEENSLQESEEIVSEEPKKVRALRKKVTLESHMENYEIVLDLLDKEIERKKKEREKGIRSLTSIRSKVLVLKKEAPKISKVKRKSRPGNFVSGFTSQCRITEEMADFLQIPHDSTISRTEITNAICTYARLKPDEKRPQILKWSYMNPGGKRNLQNPDNKMAVIPDDALGKLLGYEDYAKKVADGKVTINRKNKETLVYEEIVVTDPSLRYCMIQRLINSHILETIRKEKHLEG